MLPAPMTTIGRGADGTGQRCRKSFGNSPATFTDAVIDAQEVAMLACVAGETTMPHTISAVTVRDIRTPTSRTLAGSDATHTDPDYFRTYGVLRTDNADKLEGHGRTFTIGRGNEVCVAAALALAPLVQGLTIESI